MTVVPQPLKYFIRDMQHEAPLRLKAMPVPERMSLSMGSKSCFLNNCVGAGFGAQCLALQEKKEKTMGKKHLAQEFCS